MADWLEGCVLFGSEQISQSDALDVLLEAQVYSDQDFANAFLESVWSTLGRRASALAGPAPFRVEARTVHPTKAWNEDAAYSYCLFLSLQQWYGSAKRPKAADFNAQGELFEELARQSLAARGWRVLSTGWSRTKVAKLGEVVQAVADHLGDSAIPGAVKRWTSASSKDLGLDLVCDMPFPDGRGARPFILMQCASGRNWKEKLYTPDVGLWKRLVDFTSSPQRAFALPLALERDEFVQSYGSVDGLLLDRLRLVAPAANTDWIGAAIKERIVSWLTPRVTSLPSRDAG